MIDVLMPQLGESVAEGTVTKWLVREGDVVKREQPLLEVATDKADTEIPAPAAGHVARLVATEGSVIPKGGLLYLQRPPDTLGTHQSAWLDGVGRILVRIGGFRPAPELTTNS